MPIQPPQTQAPMTVDELLELAGRPPRTTQIPMPMSPQQQGYAPGGPQINFTGGSPFPVNEGPATLQNGLIMLTELKKAIEQMRKGKVNPGGPQGPAMPGMGQ